jgi:hypothetical protein
LKQQTTFQAIAAAQLKAWREAAQRILAASTDLAAGHRAKLDAAVEQMRADVSAAEVNLQKLAGAGGES